MPITFNSSAKTNRDWKTQFQFTDGDTGDLLDFTGAYIEISVEDSNRCEIISATTDNAKITIIGLGTFELTVDDSEMNMCAGTYNIGGFYQLNDETIDLFEGELTVRRGIGKP